MSTALRDHIRELAMTLTPEDKLVLMADLVQQLQGKLTKVEKRPFRSLLGALKDLGPAPSAEDIDEVRRQEWANFPREDIAK